MENSAVRDRVSGLLVEIADLVGAASPTPSSTLATPFRLTNQAVPAALISRPATSTPTVLSELRSRFAPYEPTSRTRLAGRSAQRRSQTPSIRQSRPWYGRFFCLSKPTDIKTPSLADRQRLGAFGLGESVVEAASDATALQLNHNIHQVFPKLGDVEIELLRALSGGYGKPLIRISAVEPILPVEYFKAAASRISMIYIRPLQEIFVPDEEENTDSSSNMETNDLMQIQNSQNDHLPEDIHTNSSEMSSRVVSEVLHIHQSPIIPSTSRTASTSVTGLGIEYEEIQTLEDYRARMYSSNSGEQFILVSREPFLERLFGVYKNPNFNFQKKPRVEFAGEAGSDLGALSREFFWKGLISMTKEKFDGKYLFEGEPNHQLPTIDSRLLRSDVYRTVGLFVAHGIMHCGIGFLGLSEAVVEFITTDEIDSDSPFTITIKDIPDPDVRAAITLGLSSGATLTDPERLQIQEIALMSDFNEVIELNNSKFAIDHLLYHHVIERRRPYLEAIKSGLRKTGVFEFIVNKPYLRSGMFPRSEEIMYPASLIAERISSNDDRILAIVVGFIHEISEDGEKLPKLLQAWTGWPILPEGSLQIHVEEDCEFKANTCFNQIQVPRDIEDKDLLSFLNLLINAGAEGFGAI